jgi:WD40 repeat protein
VRPATRSTSINRYLRCPPVSGVTAIAVTPDGRCTISASYDNTLRVWELETGQSMCILQGHSGGVIAVAITPDGGRAISASDDKSLRVWELETGQELVLLI